MTSKITPPLRFGCESVTSPVQLLARRAYLWAALVVTFAALISSAAEFSSSSDIVIPDVGNATPFPSTIKVSGVAGAVSGVQVKLTGFSHTYPSDLNFLLVGPSGQVCAVMTHAGGGYHVSNANLIFDDTAGLAIPYATAITSGAYRPANYGVQTLPPGGTGTIGTNLTALAAGGVNGDWKLFVNDTEAEDSGIIQSWSLVLVGPSLPHGYSTYAYGPPDADVVAGQSASFSAFIALGTSFQWKFQGTDLPGQTNVLASAGDWSFLRLSLDNVQPGDAGTYTLVASNADGSFSLNFTLEIEPLTISLPYFYAPAYPYASAYEQGVVSGTAFYLTTYVDSSVPVTYRWRRYGIDYPGTNASLSFASMSAADIGEYSVVASNSYGERTSATITIILLQNPPVPEYPYNVQLTRLLGSDTSLRADLLWSVANSFQWYFNGTAIAGATNSELFLTDLNTNQSGNYYATATNLFGIGTTSNFTITVATQAPVAYYYARAMSAYVEDSVELGRSPYSAAPTIEGGPPPAIQWSFQGPAVPSATNFTLQLSNLTLEQTGDYIVIATNLYGATTQTVSLVVQPRRALDRWATLDSTMAEDLYGIIFANGQFVVVGYEGTILTSPNGTNWTRRNSGSGRDLHALTYAGGQYVAVGKKGTVLTSPDAIVWTSRPTPTTNYLERIAYGNGIYVAVGTQNTFLTSSNAINWTVHSNALPPDAEMEGLAYGDGYFVAAGGYKHYRISLNTDNNPGMYIYSTVTSAHVVSSNGVDWTDVGVDVGVHLRGVTFANGTFLTVGNDGRVLYSTNATNWVTEPGTLYFDSYNLRGATYGAGRFVVVGNYGSVYSAHIPGESLQPHAPVGLQNLHDVAYGFGKFVAVGNAGTIVQSAAPLPSFSAAGRDIGAFHFTVNGGAESNYTVQSSTDFWSWTNVATFTNNGTGLSVTNAIDDSRRFYRAVNP